METHTARPLDTDSEVMVKRLFIVAELLSKSKVNRKSIRKHLPTRTENQPAPDVRYRRGIEIINEDRQDATT